MDVLNLSTGLPGRFAGMTVRIVDAQEQARTKRDVRGPWVRPKVPSKARGRRGTRRAWKRKNAPHYLMFYREPDDVRILNGQTIIATPAQIDALRRYTQHVRDHSPGREIWTF